MLKAVVHEATELLNMAQINRFTVGKTKIPETWGEAIPYRIGKQNILYRNTYPMGSVTIGATN